MLAIHGRLDLINAAVIRQSHLHLSVMLVATLGDSTDWAPAVDAGKYRFAAADLARLPDVGERGGSAEDDSTRLTPECLLLIS